MNDGTDKVYQSVEIRHDEAVPEPEKDPVKSGYRFTGWYLDEAGTEKYDFTSPVTDDLALYAGWSYTGISDTSPSEYTVTFHAGDGYWTTDEGETKEMTLSGKPGTPILDLLIENPVHAALVFAGWSTDSTGAESGKIADDAALAGNIDLYAIWKEAWKINFELKADSLPANSPSHNLEEITAPDSQHIFKDGSQSDLNKPDLSFTYGNDTINVKTWVDENGKEFDFTNPGELTADTTLYPVWEGYEITDGVYHVTNEYGLRVWEDAVRKDPTLSCTLDENINLYSDPDKTHNWVSIPKFEATFDGGNKTISNVNVTDGDGNAGTGIIDLAEGATIKNLTIDSIMISGIKNVGALIGHAKSTTITNCNVKNATVTGGTEVGGLVGKSSNTETTISDSNFEGTITGSGTLGGIVGYNGDSTLPAESPSVTGCTFEGDISSTGSNVGGIAGYNAYGNITSCNVSSASVKGDSLGVGGIVGYNLDGTIDSCIFNGSDITGGSNVGGVVGSNDEGTISGCSVKGWKIEGTGSTGNIGGVVGINNGGTVSSCSFEGSTIESDADNTGGVAGSNNDRGEIIFCSASGKIKGAMYTGGIVGLNESSCTTMFCHSSSTIDGKNSYIGGAIGWNKKNANIAGCYFTGSVSVDTSSRYYIGGFAGRNDGNVIGCYTTGDVTGRNNYAGGAIGEFYGGNIDGLYWQNDMEEDEVVGSNESDINDRDLPDSFDYVANARRWESLISWANSSLTDRDYDDAYVDYEYVLNEDEATSDKEPWIIRMI